jgi:hypothetical protein
VLEEVYTKVRSHLTSMEARTWHDPEDQEFGEAVEKLLPSGHVREMLHNCP